MLYFASGHLDLPGAGQVILGGGGVWWAAAADTLYFGGGTPSLLPTRIRLFDSTLQLVERGRKARQGIVEPRHPSNPQYP